MHTGKRGRTREDRCKYIEGKERGERKKSDREEPGPAIKNEESKERNIENTERRELRCIVNERKRVREEDKAKVRRKRRQTKEQSEREKDQEK